VTVYTLENLVTNKLKDFHVKLLTQYDHDELNSDINEVAQIDEEFTEITQVLNHRFKGSKKNLANLELFLIWEDDPKPQWFPWNSSFRSVGAIHRYFEDNQMRRFIPTEFTWGKDHPEYIPPNRLKRQRSCRCVRSTATIVTHDTYSFTYEYRIHTCYIMKSYKH